MPIDPPSRGTWIGANDAGIVACLLNTSPSAGASPAKKWVGRRSRGLIVPQILHAESIESAVESVRELNPVSYPPFRLLVLDISRQAVCMSDGESLVWSGPTAIELPMLLTSSGLGDALVEPVRCRLFEQALGRATDPFAAQANFHRHIWPEATHLSVLMSRSDARTVSRTSVDVLAGGIELRYSRLDDHLRTEGESLQRLPRLRVLAHA